MMTILKVIWSIIKFIGGVGYAILEAIAVIILLLAGPFGWFILVLCCMSERNDKMKQLENEIAFLKMTSKAQKG